MNSQAEDSRIRYFFDRKATKILEGLVYAAFHLGKGATRHSASKVLYFADREHLANCGRMIFDDTYVAMRDGPVPSIAYDLMKQSTGTYNFLVMDQDSVLEALESQGRYQLCAKRPPNLDSFSKSEIDCLDNAVEFCRGKGFMELSKISHDSAWRSADRNNDISLQALVDSLEIKDKDILGDYLSQNAG